MKVVLHLFKKYKRDQSLLNDIVESCRGNFKNIVCYIGGEDDGNNAMTAVADKAIYLKLSNKAI
jgi:hypothetical protein